MSFNIIDIETWKRREYYNHYMHNIRCTYSTTHDVDITELLYQCKTNNIKIYASIIYMLTTAVNMYKEFRTNMNTNGKLGYWDNLNPSYTIFNKKSETFSNIWTTYKTSFSVFHKDCVEDILCYSNAASLTPKSGMPNNSFNISSLPWINFSSFNINVYGDGSYLLPIFTTGKFNKQNGKTVMPLAIQVHHAVCDGYHVGKFFNTLQTLATTYAPWFFS